MKRDFVHTFSAKRDGNEIIGAVPIQFDFDIPAREKKDRRIRIWQILTQAGACSKRKVDGRASTFHPARRLRRLFCPFDKKSPLYITS